MIGSSSKQRKVDLGLVGLAQLPNALDTKEATIEKSPSFTKQVADTVVIPCYSQDGSLSRSTGRVMPKTKRREFVRRGEAARYADTVRARQSVRRMASTPRALLRMPSSERK